MNIHLNDAAVWLYAAVFVAAACRVRQWRWLGAAAGLWLLGGVTWTWLTAGAAGGEAGGTLWHWLTMFRDDGVSWWQWWGGIALAWDTWLAANAAGLFSRFNLYWAHAYIFAGSLLFFIGNLYKIPQQPFFAFRRGGDFLALWACAALAQHTAWLLWTGAAWWGQGGQVLWLRLWQMYALSPVQWYVLQSFLMLWWWLHGRTDGGGVRVGRWRFWGAVLLAVLWQLAELIRLPLLLRYWFGM